MAMEDALVLAEVLHTAESVERALDTYVARRRPRVDWVAQQSREIAMNFRLPPAVFAAALRERGDQEMHERYRPLVPAP
jgi:2-polyprenyl-6-methoxyphenol hydroxylase-like FAD-dependent oxidoreductase